VPIEILKKEKFEKGLVTYQDSRDLDESSLANATNVMCDLPGKIRQMGREQLHAEEPTALTGNLTPGYGLFAFNADYNIGNATTPAKLLAYQNGNDVNIFDSTTSTEHASELSLGTDSNIVKPQFYYINGALRVSDTNFNNDTTHQYVKSYSYIEKTLFQGFTDTAVDITGDWNKGSAGEGLDAYIYPPTQNGSTTGTLTSNTGLSTKNINNPGNISLVVTGANGGGEWIAEDESAYVFGISLTYEGDQESPITAFKDEFDATSLEDDFVLHLTIYVGSDGETTSFDPRITGCKVWLMGDSTGNFDDPMYLANFYWGKSSDERHFLESHRGDKKVAADFSEATYNGVETIFNTASLEIPTMPALTYALLNPGQSHLSESTAARYKTSIIANRRTYIGGVKRYGFDTSTIGSGQRAVYKQPVLTIFDSNADRILRSPVNKFDIFPNNSIIDVALNDGESITALESFSDRIFQFKEKTLYIINISGDFEYLEAEERYKGVEEQYQVVKTEYGIAWVNKNGCYLYSEENGILNLIDGKLELNHHTSAEISALEIEGWQEFIGQSAMIGYIQDLKQLIIFQDPANPFTNGNVMIYDFRTGSWTRGVNRVDNNYKSNIVTNYGDNCLYLSAANHADEVFNVEELQVEDRGEDAWWVIENVNLPVGNVTGAKLQLNGVDITDPLNYDAGDSTPFLAYLFEEITSSDSGIIDWAAPFDGGNKLRLVMKSSNSNFSTYSNTALTWVNSTGSVDAVTITQPSYTVHLNALRLLEQIPLVSGDLGTGIQIAWTKSDTSPSVELLSNLVGSNPSSGNIQDYSNSTGPLFGQGNKPQMKIDGASDYYIDLWDNTVGSNGGGPLSGGENHVSEVLNLRYNTHSPAGDYYDIQNDGFYIAEENDDYIFSPSSDLETNLTGEDVTISFPSLVIRKNISGDVLTFTMIGDYSNNIATSAEYTITGLGSHGDASAIETALANKIQFNYIQYLNGVTTLTALETHQNDGMKTAWDSVNSFATEVETPPSVVFTFEGDVFNIGERSSGIESIPGIFALRPNRKAENTADKPVDMIYSVSIQDHIGRSFFNQYTTIAHDFEVEIATELESLISTSRTGTNNHASRLWDSEIVPEHTVDITSIPPAGDIFTVDVDLEADGIIAPEEVIKIGTYYFKVASYTVGGGSTTITIRTDNNLGTAGYQKDTSNLATGDGQTLTEGGIKLTGLAAPSDVTWPSLSTAGWVVGDLDVKEFINSVDYGLSHDAVTSDMVIETPDYTFGNPGSTKAFYKIAVTTKSSNDYNVEIAFDGSDSFTQLYSDLDTYPSAGVNPDRWDTRDFYMSSEKSPISNIKSVRFRITAPTMRAFQLNDMTVFYRQLGIR